MLEIAERLLPSGSLSRNTIRADLAEGISRTQALGFCVSEAPDLLSQWRGYADDAQGVAIGFDRDDLSAAISHENATHARNLVLQKVAYKNSSLAHMMKGCLRQIAEHDKNLFAVGRIVIGGSYTETPEEKARYREWKERNDVLYDELAALAYAFKSKFFEEEKEWRIYDVYQRASGRVSIPDVEFLSTAQLLKPFVSFPKAGFSTSIVREVVLGPRNRTPREMIRLFLDEHEFSHVKVTPSSGTYQ